MSCNIIGLPGLEAIKRLTGWDNINEDHEKEDYPDDLGFLSLKKCTAFSLLPAEESFHIGIFFSQDKKQMYVIVGMKKNLLFFNGSHTDSWRDMIDGLKLVRSLVRGKTCLYYMLDRNGQGHPNAYSTHLLAADELPSPLQAGYSEEYEDPDGQWPGFNSKRYSLPQFRRAFFNRPDVIETLDPQQYRPYRYGWLLQEQFEQALALEEKLKMPLKDRLCGGRYYEERDDDEDDDE